MLKKFAVLAAVAVVLSSSVALADFFSIEIDAQAGYTQLGKIERPDTYEMTTLKGGTVGVHGKLEILLVSVVADYQHFFNNADLLHLGLGMDFKLPLEVVEPYIRGSAGLMLLYADGGAFSPKSADKFETTAGAQVRVGAGLDIPFGEWFAIGAAVDVDAHYLTEEIAFGFSVMGYLGLRI